MGLRFLLRRDTGDTRPKQKNINKSDSLQIMFIWGNSSDPLSEIFLIVILKATPTLSLNFLSSRILEISICSPPLLQYGSNSTFSSTCFSWLR